MGGSLNKFGKFTEDDDVVSPTTNTYFIIGCTVTLNSNQVTINNGNTSNLKVGMTLSGTNIPSNTSIQSISSATEFIMTANATANGSTEDIKFSNFFIFNCTISNSSNTVTLNTGSLSSLEVGMKLTGNNIPANTNISAISSTNFTMTNNATSTNNSESITFVPNELGMLEGNSDTFLLGRGISTNYSGDLIVVGIQKKTTSNEHGIVRVYQWDFENWNRVGGSTELTYDGSGDGSYFGFSVSVNSNKGNYVNGEKTTLSQVRFVVGSYGADKDSEPESGSIFIIGWNGSDWYKMTYNNGTTDYTEIYTEVRNNDSPGNNADGDEFGKIVAMNQDGNVVAVGAPGYDTNKGAVYLYRYNSTTSKWGDYQGDFISGSSSDTLANENGLDINYYGDVLVVSASGNQNVEVYRCNVSNSNILGGTSASWLRIFRLTLSNIVSSVSINKDINSNGSGTLNTFGTKVIIAVGNYLYNSTNSKVGKVRVWQCDTATFTGTSNNTTGWSQLGTDIKGTIEDQKLGRSCSLNGSGSRLLIGSHCNGSDEKGKCELYIYDNGNNVWISNYTYNGTINDEKIGKNVSLNGDGKTAILAAPFYNSGNTDGEGRIIMVKTSETPTNEVFYDWFNKGSIFFSNSSAFNDNLAGEHICINYCGDTLIAGMPGYDSSYSNVGALYFYQYSNNTWNQKGNTILENNGTDTNGYLGRSVALNSNRGNNTNSETDLSQIRIIGGQPGFNRSFIYQSNTNGTLSSMLYNNGTSDYIYIAASNHSDSSSSDNSFGDCVAINQDGTVIAIGMPQYSSNIGRIFFYKYNTTSSKWEEYGYTPTHSNQIKMGTSIALNYDGTLLVAGGPEKNTNQGCVRIYIKDDSTTGWTSETTYNSSVSGEYLGKSVAVNMDNNSQGTGTTSDPVTFGNGSTDFIYCGGAPDNSNGKVYVWKYNGSTITQLGNSILGSNSNDKFGSSVSLNGDGTILCIGSEGHSSNKGTVRVYKYTNDIWYQVGSDFDGEYNNKYLGASVSIRGDGKLYAAGGPGNDTSDTNTQGIVEVNMYGKQDMPCFPEGEVVLTDQGLINIEDITTDNSIDGYRVKMRTRVIFDSKEAGNMLLVQKDAFGKDNPNKDTFITQEHGIYVKHEDTEFVRARELVDGDKVKIVQKDYVYVHTIILHNVHHHMFVNNMKCETTPWSCRPKCRENFFP